MSIGDFFSSAADWIGDRAGDIGDFFGDVYSEARGATITLYGDAKDAVKNVGGFAEDQVGSLTSTASWLPWIGAGLGIAVLYSLSQENTGRNIQYIASGAAQVAGAVK